MKTSEHLFIVILAVSFACASFSFSAKASTDVGSLLWTERTGGALTESEQLSYLVDAVPGLLIASFERIFSEDAPKIALAELAPPATPIVTEALSRLRASSDPAFVNHSIRTAYWTLVVMKRENPHLTPREIEEAWIAALMHDIGLALPPESGEFTLGGVKAVHELSEDFSWDKDSEKRASEAITLNPNSNVDREKFGLLAWAMNVGGFGETFYGPYRALMNKDDINELEAMYPRNGLYERSDEIVEKELHRFPNQRFGLLKRIGFLRLRRKD